MRRRIAALAAAGAVVVGGWLFAAPADAAVGTTVKCNSVVPANSPQVQLVLGLLGIVLGPTAGSVGLNCSPAGPTETGPNVYCAQNNSFNGLIALGLSPGRCTN
jgi:hypothetical protein